MNYSLEEAFPSHDPGVQPFGSRVLCQLRTSRTKTKGGVMLIEETRETEKWNTQVAKVIALGSLAFRNRTTMEPWPEGNWCNPGDFIRVPKYGGDRWEVDLPDGETAMFILFNDLDVVGKITGDPLEMKAFL
jgi:co-chaperonin GroES (HSP10)